MANFDNQSTREEQERTASRHDDGVLDGFDAAGIDAGLAFVGYPMPAAYCKEPRMMTSYDRGFVFGYWWRLFTAKE